MTIIKGTQIKKFTCPRCGNTYAAPIYAVDFICKNCATEDQFDITTKSMKYKQDVDSYLIIGKAK